MHGQKVRGSASGRLDERHPKTATSLDPSQSTTDVKWTGTKVGGALDQGVGPDGQECWGVGEPIAKAIKPSRKQSEKIRRQMQVLG